MADATPSTNGPSVRFHAPSAALRSLVTSLYVVEAHGPLVDYLHPEWANIRLVISGSWTTRPIDGDPDPIRRAILFGPTDRTRVVMAQSGLIIGIGLTPIGWSRLVRADASQYANQVADPGDLFGSSADALAVDLAMLPEAGRIETLMDMLEARVETPSRDEKLIEAIHERLLDSDHNSAALLATAVGVSERTLHRLCLRGFGFPPKRLLRRQRFLRALDEVGGENIYAFSATLGDQYYDQSHFIREFRHYMGMTPTAYYQSPRAALRRAAIERKRMMGASLQGLHPPVQ